MSINVPGFLDTLQIMFFGMAGGLLVMGIICLILTGLYRIGKRSTEAKKQ